MKVIVSAERQAIESPMSIDVADESGLGRKASLYGRKPSGLC